MSFIYVWALEFFIQVQSEELQHFLKAQEALNPGGLFCSVNFTY